MKRARCGFGRSDRGGLRSLARCARACCPPPLAGAFARVKWGGLRVVDRGPRVCSRIVLTGLPLTRNNFVLRAPRCVPLRRACASSFCRACISLPLSLYRFSFPSELTVVPNGEGGGGERRKGVVCPVFSLSRRMRSFSPALSRAVAPFLTARCNFHGIDRKFAGGRTETGAQHDM